VTAAYRLSGYGYPSPYSGKLVNNLWLTGGVGCPGYGRPMDAFAIDRSDGREDGEDWTENYEELPGGANISIILESTTKAGVGPRLHKHPYAETFIIRRGWAHLYGGF